MVQRTTLSELQAELEQNISATAEDPDIALDALFPPVLMRTGYFTADSIDEFFQTSPIDKPVNRYAALDSQAFETYVQSATVFDSWNEMLRYGGKEWVARQWDNQWEEWRQRHNR